MTAVFTARRAVLAGICEKAAAVVPAKDALPVLTCFLIEARPGALRVTGTDLEQFLVVSSPSVQATEPINVALPARKLYTILKEAPEGDITISVDGAFVKVIAEGVSWELRAVDTAEFPVLPTWPETGSSVLREEFLTALQAVRHAISKDGARPAHRCADVSGGYITASDGQRLMRMAVDFGADMRIPSAAVAHLLRLLGVSEAEKLSVAESEQWLFFGVGSVTFGTKKHVSRYPDVEKLIITPALGNTEELAVSRAKLAEAIRRVRINADPETSAIGLRLGRGTVTVSSKDRNGNSAEQQVQAVWEHAPRLVVVQHVFLTEMLAAWPHDMCWLRFSAPDSKRKQPLVLLTDGREGRAATRIGVLHQLHAGYLGYA